MTRRLALLSVLVACESPPAPRPVASSAPATGSPSMSAPTATSEKLRVVTVAPDMDALSQIRTARLEAKSGGRVLAVYVGASWCEPCKKLKTEILAGRLDARLPKITLLAFDADEDQERLALIGYRFRSIPYVALPGADGQPVDSREVDGRGRDAWRELVTKLEAWQSPVSRSSPSPRR